MGALSSKSPLERRNTVLRRSQRKSVHAIRAKVDRLLKDIRKFKATEEDAAYADLKARIATLERDLHLAGKNLQPQVRLAHGEALKRAQECHQALEDKLQENRAKAPPEAAKEDDDVFAEEEQEGEEEVEVQRRTVELPPIEASPQSKRLSVIRVGVPVMPGAFLEDLSRKSLDTESHIAAVRKKIELVEEEISRFVGKKGGKYYGKIQSRLQALGEELDAVPALDDAIAEQVKLCHNYIASCVSFLNEKVVEDEDSEASSDEGDGGPPEGALNGTGIAYPAQFSPRTMRTTYI